MFISMVVLYDRHSAAISESCKLSSRVPRGNSDVVG